MKKILSVLMAFLFVTTAFAGKDVMSTVSGNPTTIFEKGKTATLEICYDKMVVTDSKHHDKDMNFIDWMKSKENKNGENDYLKDWPQDEKECLKKFAENFNKKNDNGITISDNGTYKIIIRLTMIDWGPALKYGITGLKPGSATITGEFELLDENGNSMTIISFKDQKGASNYGQIARLKGALEWLGNDIISYAKKALK